MEPLKLSKGMALMIRAVLNIEPARVEAQINDLMAKAEGAATGIQQATRDFDARLRALEESHNRIATMLERWDHERHDFNAVQFNANTGAGHDG